MLPARSSTALGLQSAGIPSLPSARRWERSCPARVGWSTELVGPERSSIRYRPGAGLRRRAERASASRTSSSISSGYVRPGRLPQLRKHRDRGEAGDRVDLVEQETPPALLVEEVDPGHASARSARNAAARGRAPRPPTSAARAAGMSSSARGRGTCPRSRRIARRGDLARDRDPRGRPPSTPPRSRGRSRPPRPPPTRRRSGRPPGRRELGEVVGLGHAHRRAHVGGLHEQREAQRPRPRPPRRGVDRLRTPATGLRYPGSARTPWPRLVHAQRRAQHAAADVGQASQLQEPLDLPSSPRGPCSNGKTTTCRPALAPGPTRAVDDAASAAAPGQGVGGPGQGPVRPPRPVPIGPPVMPRDYVVAGGVGGARDVRGGDAETSCSAERPPKTTTSRVRPGSSGPGVACWERPRRPAYGIRHLR